MGLARIYMDTGFTRNQSNIQNYTNSLVVSNRGSSPFLFLFSVVVFLFFPYFLSVTCLLQPIVLTLWFR